MTDLNYRDLYLDDDDVVGDEIPMEDTDPEELEGLTDDEEEEDDSFGTGEEE